MSFINDYTTSIVWETEDPAIEDLLYFEDVGLLPILRSMKNENDYWATANKFIESILHRNPDYLSERQRDWFSDILIALRMEYYKREAIEAYKNINVLRSKQSFEQMINRVNISNISSKE